MGADPSQKHETGSIETIESSLSAGAFGRNVSSTRPQPSKMLWTAIIATVVVIAGVMIFMLTHHKPAEKSNDPLSTAVLTVKTSKAELKSTPRHLSVNGSVSAWDPLAIGAEVQGLRIDSIRVEEGDQVKTGQVLATLNSSVLRAQLEQQKARLAADQAGLKKAIQPNRVEDLNTWRAALSQAEANVAQEEANLFRAKSNAANLQAHAHRYTELRKEGAVSQMETDNAVTSSKTANADMAAAEKKVEAMRFALKQAREKLLMAERGGRHEDILISQAGMQETTAKVKQLEAQIEQTIIRAPDDGKIIKREAHLGEISSIGKTMFTMVRDNRLELRAYIPEADIGKLQAGQPVEMTPSMHNKREKIIGRIREISPSVDERTRLGMVRIDIPNSGHKIKPGLFFHAKIDLGVENVLSVPSRAVLSRDEHDVVYVLNGNHAQQRRVTIGEPLGEAVEILEGLQPGEEVIVTGAGFMKDGDLVRIAPADSSEAASGQVAPGAAR
ncbi:MAG: efflux RND transporter periplasmic adaptor subunit [Candidatus Obscuribacterales bacterium]|jgi:HlyD family secretion protein|nr:efflux RND transporter periplasmic adaptor subunit [Candidatus Obscuribacterales bacterium]